MKFTLAWLKEYLETDASLERICDVLTEIGLEVEGVTDRGPGLAPFTVAEVLEATPHPDADRLRVCKVNTGAETLQIVCGAPNARAGIKVALGKVGAVIPNGGFTLKQAKIRGVESCGMMCSARELELGDDHDGIIELPLDVPVGAPLLSVLSLEDPVIEVAITPDRGDCLGVYGIARDLAAAGAGTLKPLTIPQIQGDFESPVSVTIEDREGCPYFLGRLVRGVKNGPSPEWLQNRLKAVGLQPISKLVDVTNYISQAFGRPLHVYDADTLKGGIVVRNDCGGQAFKALDNKEYTLADGMTAITDASGVLGLGGIIGGETTGCTDETVNVFIECAWFDRIRIAQTGRALQVESDARYRFERKVDPAFVEPGIQLATQMVQELCGGEPSAIVHSGEQPPLPESIRFRPNRVGELGGVSMPEAQMQQILESLGCAIRERMPEHWQVSVPSWRPDMEGEPDVVEEVLRIYGLSHLREESLPPLEGRVQPLSLAARRASIARHVLAGRGYLESCNWAFISREQAGWFGETRDDLELQNPIHSALNYMRPTLLAHLLLAAGRNANRGMADVALCEVGNVYDDPTPEGQRTMAAGLRTGQAVSRNPHGAARAVDIYDAKADALALLAAVGINPEQCQLVAEAPGWYHPGRSGVFRLGPKLPLAYFGELHPGLLRRFDIKGRAVACELLLSSVPEPKKQEVSRPVFVQSDFQASARDFAFIVDAEVEAGRLVAAMRKAEKQLLERVDVFDIYQGKGVAEGKKSVAVGISLRAADRTLTEAELQEVSSRLVKAVCEATGGELRG